MSDLSNASVAEYLGITPEQVRIMRLHKLTCPDCVNVHISFPTIRAFHSPLCEANRKCANCGKEMPEMVRGHVISAGDGPKQGGYTGFFSTWYFDADGKFVGVGSWE